MKSGAFVFWSVTIFLLIATPVHWVMTKDPVGTTVLAMALLMTLMIAGYLILVARKTRARPEDIPTAEVHMGAGEVGFFPPASIWPFWCGLTLALLVIGLCVGVWVAILGVALGVWSLCGWVYQYYVGHYSH